MNKEIKLGALALALPFALVACDAPEQEPQEDNVSVVEVTEEDAE